MWLIFVKNNLGCLHFEDGCKKSNLCCKYCDNGIFYEIEISHFVLNKDKYRYFQFLHVFIY